MVPSIFSQLRVLSILNVEVHAYAPGVWHGMTQSIFSVCQLRRAGPSLMLMSSVHVSSLHQRLTVCSAIWPQTDGRAAVRWFLLHIHRYTDQPSSAAPFTCHRYATTIYTPFRNINVAPTCNELGRAGSINTSIPAHRACFTEPCLLMTKPAARVWPDQLEIFNRTVFPRKYITAGWSHRLQPTRHTQASWSLLYRRHWKITGRGC